MSDIRTDNRYMEFRLGDQVYAIPLLTVKEVIQKPEVTTVPNMPAHFEGMMNLRGQILGIFNVKKKIGAKTKDATQPTQEVVIVIEQDGTSVGMITDEVTRVLYATEDMIGPAPLKKDDPARKYITSVIQTEKNLLLLVDVGELLDIKKFAA